MKRNTLDMALLFDFYGELLTEKQQTLFDLYYNQDFSLGEIAENEGISRQGVHDAIARAEQQLCAFEERMHCVERARQMQTAVSRIQAQTAVLAASQDPAVQAAATKIQSAVKEMVEEPWRLKD